MKSLHLLSSPQTTLLFCGIYFCFTIILSPLSDSQFSIFDVLLIHFTGLLFTIKFFIESSFVNHRGILFVLFFDSQEEFSIQFSFKPSQYFLCLKKHIGPFLNPHLLDKNVDPFWILGGFASFSISGGSPEFSWGLIEKVKVLLNIQFSCLKNK